MNKEVLNCPCCSSDNIKSLTQTSWYDNPNNIGKRAILCCNCGLTMYGINEREALKKWNTRNLSKKCIERLQKVRKGNQELGKKINHEFVNGYVKGIKDAIETIKEEMGCEDERY